MPNPIKYSVSAQTLALKRGNFWIGTGDVGKGPTSTTDYYNGITPPAGGYTIYLNKASGGPSIYTAANDSQLISLSNTIAGQTFATAAAALAWFATQTDKMVFDIDYEAIVTNGLVLNLDAGFTPSYPTTGTTWYDVSSSGNNGTLTNGPTFNSASNGSIVFDGVDDYATLSSYPVPDNFSYSIWVKVNGDGSQGSRGIVISNGSTYIDINFGNRILFSLILSDGSQNLIMSTNGVIASVGVWAHYAATYNRQQAKLYLNGSEVASSNYTLAPLNYATSFTVGCYDGGSYNLNGNISIAQMYNRALTAAEVSQNYNATKGRFGL
jgi:hypothetical protein